LRDALRVPRHPHLPRELGDQPFRGSSAVAAGLVTRAMLRGAAWRRLFPDIYVRCEAEMDHRAWCAAVALTMPAGAAMGGLSAAYLWGADVLARDARVSVVVPRDRRMRLDSRVAVRYTTLARDDVVMLAGLPVTSPERTAFDLGRHGPRVAALIAMDAILRQRIVKPEAVETLAHERCRWPGVPLLKEVLLLTEPLAESPMESRLRLLVVDAGLPPPVAQHEVRSARGHFIGRVDLAWRELRLALEYEGDHHREPDQFRRDVTRLNALRAAGWTVLRFTADDVLRDPRGTVRSVAAALRELTARIRPARSSATAPPRRP
jgi:Protein of unknown function (DUF559)/AbiEi antitoxin C-terminal domain